MDINIQTWMALPLRKGNQHAGALGGGCDDVCAKRNRLFTSAMLAGQ